MKIKIFSFAAILFFGLAGTGHAAIINTGGTCDLLNAVVASQADAPSMGCISGSGADIIILNQNETVTTEYQNSGNAFPLINSPLVIRGNMNTVTHNNQSVNPTRMFEVTGTSLGFENVSFAGSGVIVAPMEGGVLKALNSNISVSNSSFIGFRTDNKGGVFSIDGGSLSLKKAQFSFNESYLGGSIFIKDASLKIGASQFDNNNAWYDGGAIRTDGETTTDISNTLFYQNYAQDGSAINAGLGSNGKFLKIKNSEFELNHSFNIGGAVSWRGFDGEVDIRNTTFFDNIGDQDSAAFENNDGAAKVTIINSTFSDNSSNGTGSSISNKGEEVEFDVAYNTFINNTTWLGDGTFSSISPLPWVASSVENNIFYGNIGGDCDFASTTNLNIVNNLSNNTICGGLAPTGVFGTIASNGGFGKTHKLLAGSNAIDTAVTDPMLVTNQCPTTDQRNVFRPFDGNSDGIAKCDIGAYEVNKVLFQQAATVKSAPTLIKDSPAPKEVKR